MPPTPPTPSNSLSAIHLTTDFECGGAKRITQLGDLHWRMEANGDPSRYNKFFHFKISANESALQRILRIEIHPDADAHWDDFFMRNYPSKVWCHREDQRMVWYNQPGENLPWYRWVTLQHTWPDALAVHENHIELRLPVGPSFELFVASNPLLPYSQMVAWAKRMEQRHPGRLQVQSLGQSVEGRDIPLLRLPGRQPNLPKLLVLAGQHPSEHGGHWASQGIVEFALSELAEAQRLREAFELVVIPMINPDGNVHGWSGANAEGVNLCESYADIPKGKPPMGHENRLLWDWLCNEYTPDATIHFHGYMGLKVNSDLPGDGCYLFQSPTEIYAETQRAAVYQRLQDHLKFETLAHSSCALWWLEEYDLETQLARKFGTLPVFYEINTSTVGQYEQFNRGPQVLKAVVKALIG